MIIIMNGAYVNFIKKVFFDPTSIVSESQLTKFINCCLSPNIVAVDVALVDKLRCFYNF